MKLYYDCTVSALFMVKYHGIKLIQYRDDGSFFEDGVEYSSGFGCDEAISSTKKRYIHPESLFIFEPQLDDTVMLDRELYFITFPIKPMVIELKCISGFDNVEMLPLDEALTLKNLKITQRNDKPFIMPEVEK